MAESEAVAPRRRVGRRSGDSETREEILTAARALFAELGYDGASVRAIAARAAVDPALIRHYFGDKQALFATAMAERSAIGPRLGEAFAGPPDQLASRLADAYLRLWEDADTRPILMALARSAMTSREASRLMRDTLTTRIRDVGPMPVIGEPAARGLVAAGAQLFGIAVARHVLEMPGLAELTHDELVELVTPTVQHHLDGPGH
ncbi:hypothetical protein ARHIZOSPH14_23120 [Agromyces rhizosphaerae]|uniref:HTH tetR-type domain-containing protein n=1 Tax=Agromyces rhizosphaerae TaxID=88374 RepID=A0A9W6CYN3_9MICO|nr:TetR family transcriptional regulator [Agromyces rhizosphaerae]GLI28070.1 hypothetical protein ARHIZOSPH14_23120 [Agromyces rhizosphaerae]